MRTRGPCNMGTNLGQGRNIRFLLTNEAFDGDVGVENIPISVKLLGKMKITGRPLPAELT